MNLILSCRPRGKDVSDVCSDMLVFGPNKRKAVPVSLEQQDWGCVLQEAREAYGPFVDFLLRHIVYRAESPIMEQYHLTHYWISSAIQEKLEEKNMTWGDLLLFVYRILRTESGTENTLIVPYQYKSHWSIFILEDEVTWHIDTLNYHTDDRTDNFQYVMQMAWALARGCKPGTKAWTTWQTRKRRIIRVPEQREAWECSLAASFAFWQYLLLRGRSASVDLNKLKHYKWQNWRGRKMRLWLVQALYTEIVSPPIGFSPIVTHEWTEINAYSLQSAEPGMIDIEVSPHAIDRTVTQPIANYRVREVPDEGPRETPSRR